MHHSTCGRTPSRSRSWRSSDAPAKIHRVVTSAFRTEWTGSAAVALLRGENGPDKAKQQRERTSYVPPQHLKSSFSLILCCIFHRVIKGLQRVGALVFVWRDYFLTTVRRLQPTGTTARIEGRCFLFLCPTPQRYQIRSLRCCRPPVCAVGQQLNRGETHSWWQVQIPNTLQFRPPAAVEDKATPGETLSPTGSCISATVLPRQPARGLTTASGA